MQPLVSTAHYPSDPNCFKFDETVAPIFMDMAVRSIPNYHAAHRMHADMVARNFINNGITSVLDIGASRGGFYYHLDVALARNEKLGHSLSLHATDTSPPMCEMMRADFPAVQVVCSDIRTDHELYERQYDVVNCSYVLQFIPPMEQIRILRKIVNMVKPGGVLFLGQKEAHLGKAGNMLHDDYIDFRLRNGYTLPEIRAKTEALKGSMWPMSQKVLVDELRHKDFTDVVETTRYGVFSTLMCIK